jgi:nucleotide-binding universal stress UspA family protein
MYQKILIALDNTASDASLLPHICRLACLAQSELLLLHVADGWVARNFDQLQLAESEEMRDDWRYLEETAERVKKETGLKVTKCLALGNPPEQILKIAEKEKCDLIAMGSHGHKSLGDLWHGSTIDRVRHNTHIPILTVRAEKV